MMLIDGTLGEGGGQILRTSLTMSVITGRPFHMQNIRAGRSKPGLRPQHLTAVRAAAALCQAEVSGDALGSVSLEFFPGERAKGGSYRIDVTEASHVGKSAGSVTLIMQTVIWPLVYADQGSHITLIGGTFVPFSPPYHYFKNTAGPLIKKMGADFSCEIERWGWMSAGGGRVELHIIPTGSLRAVALEPVTTEVVSGVAGVTNLPSHIPQRMSQRAISLIQEAGLTPEVAPLRERGDGPGAGIVLWIPQAGFSALGKRGLPAEKVADHAVADLSSFMENGAAVDRFMADQLLVPMALAEGISSFSTDYISNHTLTNAQLLRQWLNINIEIQGQIGEYGQVMVEGAAVSQRD